MKATTVNMTLDTGHRPHLVPDPLDLCLVLEQLVEGGAVLDDEGRDREEGEQQHVHLQHRTINTLYLPKIKQEISPCRVSVQSL